MMFVHQKDNLKKKVIAPEIQNAEIRCQNVAIITKIKVSEINISKLHKLKMLLHTCKKFEGKR